MIKVENIHRDFVRLYVSLNVLSLSAVKKRLLKDMGKTDIVCWCRKFNEIPIKFQQNRHNRNKC